jgi:hypothetical protein
MCGTYQTVPDIDVIGHGMRNIGIKVCFVFKHERYEKCI